MVKSSTSLAAVVTIPRNIPFREEDCRAAVRRATVALFDGLFPEEWLRRGPANGVSMSVRSLAWIAAGHERHHVESLRTRYL